MLRAVVLGGVLTFAGHAMAAVTLTGASGSSNQGGTLTLTGSGFGTKATPGPMLFDDFDSGPVNSSVETRAPLVHQGGLATYGLWEKDGGGAYASQLILLDSAFPKARSTLHARAAFTSNAFWGLNLSVPYEGFTTGAEVYISFYYRMTKTSASYARQSKAWIAYDDSWADRAYWSTAYDSCEGGGWRQHRTEVGDQSFSLNGPQINGEWVRFEHHLKQSSPGGTNGLWRATVHRSTLSPPEIITQTLANVPLRTSSAEWTRWTFGGAYYSMCSTLDSATVDVDNFYLDDTQARVELGNAPTLAQCTIRELQRATTWTSNSITVAVDRGYLPDGATAYAYVYDSAGVANDVGFPILASGGTPPAAPQNLVVQ